MLDNTTNDTVYIGTFNGTFTVRCAPDAKGAVQRTTKTGQTIYEQHYNKLTGYIESLDYRKREHDGITYRSLIIAMRSNAGRFQLELDVFSDAAIKFYHVMESIDPAQLVTLSIGKKDKDLLFFVHQQGAVLKWNYTNENKRGRPDWEPKEEIDLDGNRRTVWSKVRQVQFFLEKLQLIKPKFSTNWATSTPTTTKATTDDITPPEYQAGDEASLDPPPTDDLPF
jgi:hypothetical protein